MPRSLRIPYALLALVLSFSALAGEETRAMRVTGSSGKYVEAKEAACSSATSDARQTAKSTCSRNQGRITDPLIFGTCQCEQGGFEEKEWLCSITATLSCEIDSGTAKPPAPPAVEGSDSLTLALPSNLTNLQLLDRTFSRRGFTLPEKVLSKRLDARCNGGWDLACKSSRWKITTGYSLTKAYNDLERTCDTGDNEACIALGWAQEERAIATKDGALYRRAARRYKGLCDGVKHATACYDYGTILFNELGVKADPRLGIRRWESACTLGEAAACSVLAKVYRSGIKTRVDREKAAAHATTGCSGGDPAGCVETALLLNDKVREQEQLARACSMGSKKTCWTLASSYLSGNSAEPVVGRTRTLLNIGCELGDGQACNSAGELAINDGDNEGGATQFRVACNANHVAACTNLVELILTERISGNVEEEPYAFEVACSKGDNATACSELGLAMLSGDRKLTDQPRARALLRQSCTNETSPAKPCFVLGDLYETGQGGERDRTLAARYYKWACAQGWGQACERRGNLLRDGVGVLRNHEDAVIMYLAGCDSGLASSCHAGGVLLFEGTYIPQDAKRAAELFDTGCERGVAEACLRAGNLALDRQFGRDETRARHAYESAVSLNNIEAHRRLAYMAWNGLGGAKNKKLAKTLTSKGCRNDDPVACRGPAFQTEP